MSLVRRRWGSILGRWDGNDENYRLAEVMEWIGTLLLAGNSSRKVGFVMKDPRIKLES